MFKLSLSIGSRQQHGKALATAASRSSLQHRSFSKLSETNATVVLLRHGQSTWNATPTFTGWANPPLTEKGAKEAVEAGGLLRERGYQHFDLAFTSSLDRAIETCDLALEAAGCQDSTHVVKAHQLNERHYGALQGKLKNCPDLEREHGKENLIQWRRHFKATPPPMDPSHEHYQPPPAPLTESLQDCQDRVMNYWNETIVPALEPGKNILIAAHSNTIRALVAHLDEVPEPQVPNIRIPNSVPCVYRFCEDGTPVLPKLQNMAGGTRGHWLFSAENQDRLREEIGGTGSFVQSIFDAWDTNGDGVLSLEEIQAGLRQVRRGEKNNLAMNFIAGKILQEIDADGSTTLASEEFQEFAVGVYEKYLPGFMDGGVRPCALKKEEEVPMTG